MTLDRALSEAILDARKQRMVAVIADIKAVSPRDGALIGSRDPGRLAARLVEAGACAISVVTESLHFGGSLDTLRRVCDEVRLPVLQKDFFSSPEQLEGSRACGARAVLVVLATTGDDLAFALCRRARQLGLEAVVEVHTRAELERALELEPTIIGVNNRNILELETDDGDVRVTEELAPLVPEGIVTISESSLLTEEAIRRAIGAGADAVLVGTAILRAADPAAYVGRISRAG